MLTTTLLTDYDISYRLHTLVFALTTMIGPFMVAMASTLNARNDTLELRRLLIRSTRYTAVLTVPIAFIIIVLAEPLTAYWIGKSYMHTVPATRLFVSYLLYWSLLRSGQNMLIGINKLNVILPAFVVSTMANLIVSVWLAPYLGVAGVILGTVGGNALAVIPYLVAFKRELGMQGTDLWQGIFLRVYPQAIIGALVTALLSAWHPPASLVHVGVYGATGLGVFVIAFLIAGMPLDERAALAQYVEQAATHLTSLFGHATR